MAWAAFLPEIASGAAEATAGAAEATTGTAGAVESSAPATSESTASRMNNSFAQGSLDHQNNDKEKKTYSPVMSEVTQGVM